MKVMVIGLDGTSIELINQFSSEGVLPTFSKLIDKGLAYSLESTIPPHTAPGWVSSLTGVNPGQHGIYQFWDTQSPSYIGKFMGSNNVGVPFVWDILNHNGYKTGLINIPMSHPPKVINGYMLTWPLSNTLRYCYPKDLLKEIAEYQGHYASDLVTMFQGDINYINSALEITQKRLQTIKYLVKNKPVDFFMAVFTEIDRVSHFYWHYMVSSDYEVELRDAIKQIYIETDKVLKEIIDLLDDETSLMIYSDHGFEQGILDFYVQTYLIQIGLMSLKLESDDYVIGNNWFEYKLDNKIYTVDWDRTVAYMAAPGSYGININLKGRQVNGIVEISNYETICQEIIDKLKQIENPLDKKPLFKEVVRKHSIYSGSYCSSAPDIVMIPQKWGIMVHHKITKSCLFNFRPEQKGMHSSNAFFVLYGNEIEKKIKRHPTNLCDIAPTILSLFNIKQPLYMEGKSIFSCETRSEEVMVNRSNNICSYDESEQDEIIERLKSLGYL